MAQGRRTTFLRLAGVALAGAMLAACQESNIPKDIRPLPYKLTAQIEKLGMRATSPIFVRIFKEESKLEVWKEKSDGKYALLKSYDICKWSGTLGPKTKEGDRQAPEGFYIVTPAQMNPKSSYYLSFNIGYPNAFDRAYGRTGSNLMVHGACSSSGCYSMTDADSGEIFSLARDAFKGGQREFQIQAFPFRMTPDNFAKHRDDPNVDFWRMLKVGYDHFEVTRQVPKVDVCGKRYVFDADAGAAKFVATAKCPAYTVPEWISTAVAAKEAADDQKFAAAVASLEGKAEAAAAAQEKAAAEAAREAEAASKPPLLSRWLKGSKAAATGDDAVSPETTATATSISAPAPRLKPKKPMVEANADDAPPAAPSKPKPAVAKAPPPADPTPVAKVDPAPAAAGDGTEPFPESADVAPSTPAPASKVGTMVQRKFDWPDEAGDGATN